MCVTLLIVIGVSYIGYMSLLFGIQLLKYVWNLIPNSLLTPGNELLEIGLILVSFVAAGFMFSAIKGLSELIDVKITKLKNDNQTKDAHINALEAELAKKIQIISELEETVEYTEKKDTFKSESDTKSNIISDLQNRFLQAELDGKNHIISGLRNRIVSLEKEIDALKIQLEEQEV